MRTNFATWLWLIIIAALATLAAKNFAFFPGDVALERWVQSLVPPNLSWADGISRTAEFPWILIILALIFIFSWVLAGWRAALLSVLSLAGMWVLGNWLSPLIARPRPSPEMVHVSRPLTGSSFPFTLCFEVCCHFWFSGDSGCKEDLRGVSPLPVAGMRVASHSWPCGPGGFGGSLA